MNENLTGPALVVYLRASPTSDASRAAADEIERITRNRDMWRGQCERQAKEIDGLRIQLMSASKGAEEAARAERVYRQAEALLTGNERTLADTAAEARAERDAAREDRDRLRAVLQAAVDCGMVPKSSAADGGACRHSEQVRVADQIRAELKREGS